MLKITVLKPFTEVRTGQSYTPGEVITDIFWTDVTLSRRAEAYLARGLVSVEDGGETQTLEVLKTKHEKAATRKAVNNG